MASALSVTQWIASSRSVLLRARIASRSSTSERSRISASVRLMWFPLDRRERVDVTSGHTRLLRPVDHKGPGPEQRSREWVRQVILPGRRNSVDDGECHASPLVVMRRGIAIGVPGVALATAGGLLAQVRHTANAPLPHFPDLDPSGTYGRGPATRVRLTVLGDSSMTGPGLDRGEDIWMARLADRLPWTVELRSHAKGGSRARDVLRTTAPRSARGSAGPVRRRRRGQRRDPRHTHPVLFTPARLDPGAAVRRRPRGVAGHRRPLGDTPPPAHLPPGRRAPQRHDRPGPQAGGGRPRRRPSGAGGPAVGPALPRHEASSCSPRTCSTRTTRATSCGRSCSGPTWNGALLGQRDPVIDLRTTPARAAHA